MTVGSLFTGIGGFDLAAERAGLEVRWQVEIDDYATRILERHWPDVRRYRDIRSIDWADVEPVDLICGGFPCQPHSPAGRRLGGADSRDLWPEFRRCLRALGPRWVLAENVGGLLSSEAGRFFGALLRDLAASGYDAEWDCLPASAVGAPHRRDRVWIVGHRRGPLADADRGGCEGVRLTQPAGVQSASGREPDRCRALREQLDAAPVADADCPRLEGRQCRGVPERADEQPARARRASVADPDLERAHGRRTQARRGRESSDSDPCIFGGVGPEPRRLWIVEPDVGRVAHGVPARVDRLRCLGNAIVPQVAEWIFAQITEAELDSQR